MKKVFLILVGIMISAAVNAADAPRSSRAAATASSTSVATTSARSATPVAARSSMPVVARSGMPATSVRSATPTATATASSAAPVRSAVARSATPSTATTTQSTSARAATPSAGRVGTASVRNQIVTTSTNSTVATTAATTSSLVSESCRTRYFSCMDQFCMLDNENGARCVCSAEKKNYDDILLTIKGIEEKAVEMGTVGVEKIQLGAKAEYVFTGQKTYADDSKKSAKKSLDLSILDTNYDDAWANNKSDSFSTVATATGANLYSETANICYQQMAGCESELNMLVTLYQQQITSDCRAYKTYLDDRATDANKKLLAAESAQRDALLASFEDANKFNRGECMLEYKTCMADPARGGCGSDFANCADMENPNSIAILESKKYICEGVWEHCVAIPSDTVWNDFLIEVKPAIVSAAISAENNLTQSCLKNISTCIKNACQDDLAGKTTIDACLTNPSMARSFCTAEIAPCEERIPQIFTFVKSRLAAMRVDACFDNVKSCLISEDKCGPDYANCIGLDTENIVKLCPTASLVACQENGQKKSVAQVEDLIQGLFLGIENKTLDQCQKLVDESMARVCSGDTETCNGLISDAYIGAGSLSMSNREDGYMISGLITWDSVEINDDGSINIKEYLSNAEEINGGAEGWTMVKAKIDTELRTIQSTIDSSIKTISSDPKVDACVNGRSVSGTQLQSAGNGRFPNLLNQKGRIIAEYALRAAKDNYNKKLDELLASSATNESLDSAEAICEELKYQSMLTPSTVQDRNVGFKRKGFINRFAAFFYSKGNANIKYTTTQGSSSGNKIEQWNYKETVTTTFIRDTKVCKKCTIKQNCSKPKNPLFGKKYCKKWSDQSESCTDIQMGKSIVADVTE